MAYKAALAGLDLGGGKAVIIGDPATAQDRGAAARLRPLRAVARRPLLHRLRRRHVLPRTWTSSPASAPSSPAAPSRTAAPATRSVLTAYGVFQGMRAAAEVDLGRADAARPHRRRRRRRQGRPPPGPAPRRGRRRRSSSPTSTPPPVDRGAAPSYPEVRAVADTDALVASRARRLRARARWAARSPTRSSTCCSARIVCGAANNQLAHPGIEKALAGPRHPLRARLLRERRRPDPGRRRARGLLLRAGPAARRRRSSTPPRGSSSSPTPRACRRPSPPTGSPSAGCPRSAGCAGIWLG